jgi:hypothetical protein
VAHRRCRPPCASLARQPHSPTAPPSDSNAPNLTRICFHAHRPSIYLVPTPYPTALNPWLLTAAPLPFATRQVAPHPSTRRSRAWLGRRSPPTRSASSSSTPLCSSANAAPSPPAAPPTARSRRRSDSSTASTSRTFIGGRYTNGANPNSPRALGWCGRSDGFWFATWLCSSSTCAGASSSWASSSLAQRPEGR